MIKQTVSRQYLCNTHVTYIGTFLVKLMSDHTRLAHKLQIM